MLVAQSALKPNGDVPFANGANARPKQPSAAILTCIALALTTILLMFALPRIDFHADEAIYLRGVPVNLSNDSGLVFNFSYLATSLGNPTPISARWTSLLFGVVLIFSVTRTLQILLPERARLLALLVPISIAVSYQGIFAILRVRPEISWISVTSVCCWCLAELYTKDRSSFRGLLVLSLLALPMNHMLSWFPCFFLGIYILCFASRRWGFKMTCVALGAMGCGVVLNSITRSWIVQGDLAWFPSLGSPGGGARPSLKEFTWNVFWNSPNFLNDSAVMANVWSLVSPKSYAPAISHCFVATLLWACALPLPIVMKTWESRYVASIPLLTLGLFYGSGYFNPTYTPLLVLYGLLLAAFLACSFPHGYQGQIGRTYAIALLLTSLVNGSSFLTTRVFNHGSATFFEVESLVRAEVAKMPDNSVIAVPERFESVAQGGRVKKHTLFKDVLPEHLDLVVLDNYDFEMYRFVPDYEAKRTAIEELVKRMPNAIQLDRTVYKRDTLRQDVVQNKSLAALQGSWFFRNSVNYRVSLLRSSADPLLTAKRIQDASNADSAKR